MSIELWNPKELPFGPLSNNTLYIMEINGHKYKTVTNYIYSNIIRNKKYFEALKNINLEDLYEYFGKYEIENEQNTIKASLYKALEEKYKSGDLEELLLSTEDFPIIYENNDSILGTGPNNRGQNLLGKYLADIRDKKLLKIGGTKKEKVIEAYKALVVLEKAVREDNNTLREFAGLNMKEIIDKYVYIKGIEIENLQKNDTTKLSFQDIILKHSGVLPNFGPNMYDTIQQIEKYSSDKDINLIGLLETAIKRPFVLILYVKQKYFKSLRFNQIQKLKTEIFDIYVDNIINIRYPSVPKNKYYEVKEKEFDTLDGLDYQILKDQIYDLYKREKLPKLVMEKINSSTVMDDIISEKSLKTLETMSITNFIKLNQKLEIRFDSRYSPDNIYSTFSPFAYTGMLDINGLYYPSIMHFIIATLFSQLPYTQNIQNAHTYLLYDKDGDVQNNLNYEQYDNLFYKYEDEKYYQYTRLRRSLATVALNKKFEDIGLQDLLVATGDNKIIWTDKNDDILGIGIPKNGENFVGVYMMKLREQFIHRDAIPENITINELNVIIENDIFMRSWSEMRLRDIAKIIKLMKKYIKDKHNKNVDINQEFILNVLDKVYYNCGEIKTEDVKDLEPPEYFTKLVSSAFSKDLPIKFISSVLWNKIANMIFFIAKQAKSLKNIKIILVKTELLVSQKTKCVKIIDNNFDNCIISAIVNLMKRIRDFNASKNYNTIVSKDDINTIVSIILNKGNNDKLDNAIPDFNTFINDNIDVLNVGQFTEENKEVDEKEEVVNDDKDILINGVLNCLYQEEVENVDEEEIVHNDVIDCLGEDEDDEEMEYPDDDYEPYDEGYDSNTADYDLNVGDDEDGYFEDGLGEKEFQKQKNINKIKFYLEQNNIVSTSNNILSEYIFEAVKIIKEFKMSNKIKLNRINFFAVTV